MDREQRAKADDDAVDATNINDEVELLDKNGWPIYLLPTPGFVSVAIAEYADDKDGISRHFDRPTLAVLINALTEMWEGLPDLSLDIALEKQR